MVVLLINFGVYGVFINVSVVITVDKLTVFWDFGLYGIIFTTVCVYCLIFPSLLTGNELVKF
jgi:hypothetical protein